MKSTLTQAITNDFVASFTSDNCYRGAFARLIAVDELPKGVDPTDPRVQQIIRKCKDACRDD